MGTPHTRWREMHPVRAVRHHVEDALLAPPRDPPDVALDRRRARAPRKSSLVEADEPLLGRAKERGVLAAPAVRIGVVERPPRRRARPRAEMLDDLGIRVPDRETGEVLDLRDEAAGVVDRVVDRRARGLAEVVVLLAVPGRGVDEPGPLSIGDEVRGGDLASRSIHG